MKLTLALCAVAMLASFSQAEKSGTRYCEPCWDIDAEIAPVSWEFQIIEGHTYGEPNDEYAIAFCAVGGFDYTFTFCREGGWADFDTALSIQGPDECGNYLACNDDFCGLQSEIVWTASDGYCIVVIDGWEYATGNFALAYSGQTCITPVETKTWGTLKHLY